MNLKFINEKISDTFILNFKNENNNIKFLSNNVIKNLKIDISWFLNYKLNRDIFKDITGETKNNTFNVWTCFNNEAITNVLFTKYVDINIPTLKDQYFCWPIIKKDFRNDIKSLILSCVIRYIVEKKLNKKLYTFTYINNFNVPNCSELSNDYKDLYNNRKYERIFEDKKNKRGESLAILLHEPERTINDLLKNNIIDKILYDQIVRY